ncbi:MAG: hypothetical protein ACLR3X_10505 [Intestinibacter bartlettii]
MIIVPLNGGLVQAFSAKTLEPLWTSEQIGSSSSQALSPIAYSDGYIYLGFWESETKDAQFACFSITDEDTTKQMKLNTHLGNSLKKVDFTGQELMLVEALL